LPVSAQRAASSRTMSAGSTVCTRGTDWPDDDSIDGLNCTPRPLSQRYVSSWLRT
jgi:hypothetical protein